MTEDRFVWSTPGYRAVRKGFNQAFAQLPLAIVLVMETILQESELVGEEGATASGFHPLRYILNESVVLSSLDDPVFGNGGSQIEDRKEGEASEEAEQSIRGGIRVITGRFLH
jgi:hypothetical protein